MRLLEYKLLYIVVVAVLALLVASPVLQKILVYPQTEFFTEAWILGPGHRAENYPYNVTSGTSYSIFLGLSNHLGILSYYEVQVKLRNQNQSGPDSFNRTASSLPALCSVYAFVGDDGTWELPISFSFSYSGGNTTQAVLENMVFNSNTLDLSGESVFFNPEKQQNLVNLFFEVWIYDGVSGAFEYHERSVDLWLNLQ